MERHHETNLSERTLTTLLGIARIAITSRTAEQMTMEVQLQLETGETANSWYMVKPPLSDIEDTLAYRDACEALGMDIEE